MVATQITLHDTFSIIQEYLRENQTIMQKIQLVSPIAIFTGFTFLTQVIFTFLG